MLAEKSGRQSGRTTQLLEQVASMLYDGPYKNIFFVIHHHSFAHYCMKLLKNHTLYDCLFDASRNRAAFRNKGGNIVYITFVYAGKEYESTRGYRDPIARDHHILEERRYRDVYKHWSVYEELKAAGKEPWSQIHIPK